jgi:hypothetical protein
MGNTISTRMPAGVLTMRIGTSVFVAALLFQAVSAGELLGRVPGWLNVHGVGSMGVHGGALIAAVGAIMLWRHAKWPAFTSTGLLLLTFVQSMTGGAGNLALHVPVAIVLTVLATWQLFWAWN